MHDIFQRDEEVHRGERHDGKKETADLCTLQLSERESPRFQL